MLCEGGKYGLLGTAQGRATTGKFMRHVGEVQNVYRYAIGQIIHHRRYDYRGVIVEADGNCLANDEWFHRNRTQPSRDQPWYHVLVDGGNETYVAEENLELDAVGEKIEHPLVDKVFPTFYSGRYYRQCFN